MWELNEDEKYKHLTEKVTKFMREVQNCYIKN